MKAFCNKPSSTEQTEPMLGLHAAAKSMLFARQLQHGLCENYRLLAMRNNARVGAIYARLLDCEKKRVIFH